VHLFSSANLADENDGSIFVGYTGRRKRPHKFSSAGVTDEINYRFFRQLWSQQKYWTRCSIFVGQVADENTGILLKNSYIYNSNYETQSSISIHKQLLNISISSYKSRRCIIGRQASSKPHSAGCSEFPWTMDADAGSAVGCPG
jgi:hypothetical protein